MSKKEIASSNPSNRKLRTKELIYAGAFGALYIVLMLVIVLGTSMIPVLYLLAPITVGLVCGTVYMLCVLKVKKFGAALILGVLFALCACSNAWFSFVGAVAAELQSSRPHGYFSRSSALRWSAACSAHCLQTHSSRSTLQKQG